MLMAATEVQSLVTAMTEEDRVDREAIQDEEEATPITEATHQPGDNDESPTSRLERSLR